MKLSKEFFHIVSKALSTATYTRQEFAIVEMVERELKLLWQEQNQLSSQLSPNSPTPQSPENLSPQSTVYPPIQYAKPPVMPGTSPITAAKEMSVALAAKARRSRVAKAKQNQEPVTDESSAMKRLDANNPIDALILAGMEQAKTAPMVEANLLRSVHVDVLPETKEQYENQSIV